MYDIIKFKGDMVFWLNTGGPDSVNIHLCEQRIDESILDSSAIEGTFEISDDSLNLYFNTSRFIPVKCKIRNDTIPHCLQCTQINSENSKLNRHLLFTN